MKKLILAAVLYAATVGVASAATAIPSGDAAAQRGTTDPFGVPIYVRGGFNGWGLADPMTYDSGTSTYNAVVSLDSGTWEFKVASEDWSTVDLGNVDEIGAFSPPSTVNVGRTAFGNLVLEIAAAGLYTFSLDVSSLTRGPDPFGGPFPLTVRAVPIPAAGVLLLSALGGLGFLRRR